MKQGIAHEKDAWPDAKAKQICSSNICCAKKTHGSFIAIDDLQPGSPSSLEARPQRRLQDSFAAEGLRNQRSAAWQTPQEFAALLLWQDLPWLLLLQGPSCTVALGPIQNTARVKHYIVLTELQSSNFANSAAKGLLP